MADNNTGDRRRADLKRRWLTLGDEQQAAEEAGDLRLARRCERRRDRVGSDFVAENKGLAAVYARQFFAGSGSRANQDDYISAALMGLWEAFKLWDPTESTFGNFSRLHIEGRVKRAVASAEAEGISYGDFTARQRVRAAERAISERLSQQNSVRTPTTEEIAAESGQTPALVERVRRPRPSSLDAPVGDGESRLGDLVADEGLADDVHMVDDHALLAAFDTQDPEFRRMLAGPVPVNPQPGRKVNPKDQRLSAAELFVYVRRRGIDSAPEQTLNEVGDMVGLGRETVRRHETKAADKVGAILAGEPVAG